MDILRVGPAEHPLLRNLYPLYLHDLSEFGVEYRLDEQGLWQPDFLPTWLSRSPEVHPLLLRDDGRTVGFAFVGEAPFPFMTAGRDFRMSEFFILRGERRRGLGRLAARAIFDRFRGLWEVTQLPANRSAIAFWRNVISEYTRGAFEDTEVDGSPAQVFDSRLPATRARGR
ncbi:GNAT family N-acetyltransferase [Pyxidicoccus parkwayensis]|uniref:GNAT family N-acetyltransferase n=1 Tax=Pyxidicoccus parkwayensis TaxID=2813578 RepID=A0ABX7NWG1_9BACT|nr:GNAT family N-acetyltransferase [Pyxidicoccus parkwaysis]QSQ23135.1 GNAT family N-acetyltransferase [Pyxidicoccus parkwaysis]